MVLRYDIVRREIYQSAVTVTTVAMFYLFNILLLFAVMLGGYEMLPTLLIVWVIALFCFDIWFTDHLFLHNL